MEDGTLRRSLGLGDAVVVGLASMLGAGIFSGIAPAAAASRDLLTVAVGIAGLIALCNAMSSARLAARSPAAGGTYAFAGERLGGRWGFLAGWGFVAAKIASCAALARAVAAYVLPAEASWSPRWVAVSAVATTTAINLGGVEKTARAARAVVLVVLAALAAVVISSSGAERVGDVCPLVVPSACPSVPSAIDLLRGAALMFFAFAGFARIATLGEEVREPERTIPRAVPAALGIVIAVYAIVAENVRLALGTDGLAASSAPLADATAAGRLPWLEGVVRAGAVVASLGVLLSLLAGVGRTVFAMARDGHFARALAHVHGARAVPDRAQVAVGLVVALVAAAVDLRASIGFSAFAILVYYAITNLSALRMPAHERRLTRALPIAGLLGCLLLASTLPAASIGWGITIFAAGALWYRAPTRG